MSRAQKVKIGDVFNRLTVVEYIGLNKSGNRTWRCICECGNETIVTTKDLVSKTKPTISCGCYRRERITEANFIHGETHVSSEYKTWQSMKRRCYTPNTPRYMDYGGRGITVCDEWKDNFLQFLADMGRRPSSGHSIDRLDNNGPYNPDNCVWASRTQQSRNRRSNHMITYKGETKCLTEWAEQFDIAASTLAARINTYGWSVEKAFTTPVKSKISNADS